MLVEDFKVKWQHNKEKGVTKCIIEKDREPFSTGFAILSEKDYFSYDSGRKVALSKALKRIDRSKRLPFWETYRNLTKTPRW